MQSIAIFLLITTLPQNAASNEYIGELPALTAYAPRYTNQDIAWSGLMPETIITAEYEAEKDPFWSSLINTGIINVSYNVSYAETTPTARRCDLTKSYPGATLFIAEDESTEVEMAIIQANKTFGNDYHIPQGDTIDDDVTVSSGDAEIEGVIKGDLAVMGGKVKLSGMVDGDVAVFGGNLDLTGTIEGDAAIMGGNVMTKGVIRGDLFVVGGTVLLDSGSVIEGDINMVGGTVDRDENATVRGEISSVEIDVLHKIMPRIGKAFRLPKFLPRAHIFPRLFFISIVIVLFIINLLIYLIFPSLVDRIADRLSTNVWPAVGLGLALEILYVPFIILFAVSVIGIPLIPLFVLAVLLAGLFGFSALSLIIGSRVCNGLKRNITSKIGLFCIGWLGIMIIPIIVHLIGPPVFILGWIIGYVVVTIGIGAVIYTLVKKNAKTGKK